MRAVRELVMHPLTPERWSDLEALFGERGASGGCWCMWWRLPRSQFEQQKGAANRSAFRAVVEADDPPGILAYADDQPVGWCAIAPRGEYPALERSRILRPVDDAPVWSVTCLFVAKPYRRRGVSVRLLDAAVAYARDSGARIVEGYPVEPRPHSLAMPDAFVWTGTASAFREAGFVEACRRSETRPIMRYVL
ncbi:MAG: GNAT family N-acetyltransferase [Thermomicrobiales bacterium]